MHCYSISRKLKSIFAELYVQLCTFYWSKETGKSEWVRFFVCIAHKNISNMHMSNLKSLRASWNVSLKKSLVCFPKKSNQSSNRFVKNKVTSIFGPIEDRLYRETKQQKTRSYNICVIIRLFRRSRTARTGRTIAHFLAIQLLDSASCWV